MAYPQFDTSKIKLKPIAKREHKLHVRDLHPVDDAPKPGGFRSLNVPVVADRILKAKTRNKPRILFMGGHVIKSGLSLYLIEMMKRGWVSHLAMTGSGAIHDWELATVGGTSEDVPKYLEKGEFGMWEETGQLNDVLSCRCSPDGAGETIGLAIRHHVVGKPEYPDVSVLAAASMLDIPATVHVAIGQDVVHQHYGFPAAAVGHATYIDFLIFAYSVSQLHGGGVFMNFGSAVAGPELFLKALSMARNVAHQKKELVLRFTTAVFDVTDYSHDSRSSTRYSFLQRPRKTLMDRAVECRNGKHVSGESYAVCGEHVETLSALYRELVRQSEGG